MNNNDNHESDPVSLKTIVDPFTDTDDPKFFYPEHTRIQRLRLLLHLISLDEMLLIIGEPGSGKTTLLKQFLLQAKETASVTLIDACKLKDEMQLLTTIATDLNLELETENSDQPLINQILDAFDNLQQTELRTILAIDNIHNLNTESLQYIEHIARHTKKQNRPLHIVMAGDPEIQQILDRPDLQGFKHGIIHTFELQPFDKHQTKEYILHRLHAAGIHDHSYFTPTVINRIYKKSEGLPERINALARQELNKSEENSDTTTTPLPLEIIPQQPQQEKSTPAVWQKIKEIWSQNKAVPIISATVFAAFILYLLNITNDDANKETVSQQVAALDLPAIDNNPTESPRKPVEKIDTPTEQTVIDNTVALQTENSNASQPTTPNEPQETIENRHEPSTTPQLPTEKLSSAPSLATNNESQKAAKQQSTPAVMAKEEIRGKEWINRQNPDHYTLQIFAVSKKDALIDFIKGNDLTQKSAYLRFERNGDDLYTMFYGTYENRDLATKAISDLPPSLASFKPWIRSYSSIQSAIE